MFPSWPIKWLAPLVIAFWEILSRELPSITTAQLHCLKLYETPRNFVEYYGEAE